MATVRELTPTDAPEVTALYEEYEWWEDRDVEGVRRALDATPVAMGVDDGGLVAAARVLTDYQYYAKAYDVIVAADRRGEGYGEQLLAAVRDHRALRDVDLLMLNCREGLVPFYESVGFEVVGWEAHLPDGGTEPLVRMQYKHTEAER